MADFEVRLPAAKVMRDVTMNVTVTGVSTWRIRLWLGGLLIRFAALVMGCNISMDRE
jgi:hypothetical protein